MGVQWPRWQRDEVRSPRAAGVVEGFMHQLNHQLVGGRARVHVSHFLVKTNNGQGEGEPAGHTLWELRSSILFERLNSSSQPVSSGFDFSTLLCWRGSEGAV